MDRPGRFGGFRGVLTNLNFKVSEDGCNCNFDGRRSRPGMNTVVGSVAKTFLEKAIACWPALRIFEPVYEESAYYGDRFPVGGRYFQPGGSFLTMSSFKPTDKNFERISIWTCSSRITSNCSSPSGRRYGVDGQPHRQVPRAKNIRSPIFMFPKRSTTTCRFRPARLRSATSRPRTWVDHRPHGLYRCPHERQLVLVAAMGRSAGHLAFGIGTACHYPMIVIPEMFNKTRSPSRRSSIWSYRRSSSARSWESITVPR